MDETKGKKPNKMPMRNSSDVTLSVWYCKGNFSNLLISNIRTIHTCSKIRLNHGIKESSFVLSISFSAASDANQTKHCHGIGFIDDRLINQLRNCHEDLIHLYFHSPHYPYPLSLFITAAPPTAPALAPNPNIAPILWTFWCIRVSG